MYTMIGAGGQGAGGKGGDKIHKTHKLRLGKQRCFALIPTLYYTGFLAPFPLFCSIQKSIKNRGKGAKNPE